MLRILSTFRPSSELLTENEKNGKSYIFYPAGFLYNSFDGQINQSFPMDFIPGFVDFALHSFKFKHKLNHMANLALQKAKEEYLAKNPKKKSQEPIIIGIHHRRTDHLSLQIEIGLKPLETGYFLEAMDLYRFSKK